MPFEQLDRDTIMARFPQFQLPKGTEERLHAGITARQRSACTIHSRLGSIFEAERERLHRALHPHALDIQHIGSTAVPGLAAKPILDLGIAVANESIVTACVPRLTALGYTYHGYRGADQSHFFDLGPEDRLTHYLHMLLIGDPGWWNYLRFRDYLRAHPAACAAYRQLKQDLATQYAADRTAYSAAKTTFIQRILAAAQQ